VTLAELIAQAREAAQTAITARQAAQDALVALRSDPDLTEEAVTERVNARDVADAEVTRRQGALDELLAEQAREEEIAALSQRIAPAAPRPQSRERSVRIGVEERTYRADLDPRGAQFERDVAAAFMGDYEARDRLARHMNEERAERGEYLERATGVGVGTGAFSGLVVPQFLTELYAPAAAAKRPFADAIRQHPLPAQGMTVNLSRITTGSSVEEQTAELGLVDETDMDDTLLTFPVRTNAGQQTISRQAIDRGAGIEAVVLDDLFRRYATKLDNKLINLAGVGLSAVANPITYTLNTAATPPEVPAVDVLYPKVIGGLAGVEAAMLDQASGENIAVMHSRRWYWMQSAMAAKWPLMAQPGIAAQMGGVNLGTTYGSGVRGILPNGTPVIVDNNVPAAAGPTGQDEIYLVDRQECHLWEDPDAPMFIRAEQPKAAQLGVLLVVFGYYAFTHQRYAHAQKVTGTGMVAPTF
jgi:HK97 family phage major capsid protein